MSISTDIEVNNIKDLTDMYYCKHVLLHQIAEVNEKIEFYLQFMSAEDINIAGTRSLIRLEKDGYINI